MPIMSVPTWEVKSKKGLFNTTNRRPDTLTAIDATLALYHISHARLPALRDAVNTFVGLLPNPTSGLRNALPAAQELKNEVDRESGTLIVAEISAVGVAAGTAAKAAIAVTPGTVNSADNAAYSMSVTQNTMGTDFAWAVFWKLQLTAPGNFALTSGALGALVVTLPVAVSAGTTEATKTLWQTHVGTMWKGAKFMVNGNRLLEVSVKLEWHPAGTASCNVVTTNPTPPVPAETWQQTQSRLRSGDVDDRQVGGSVGTPDLSNWGADDVCAVSHEVGHVLGLPDEYETTKYMGRDVPAGIYNQPAFTTESLMNNTGSAGRLHKRHYDTIRWTLEKWKGLTADSTHVIVPGSTT